MSDTKTVRVKVLREFNDAGAERRFNAGDVVDIGEGTAANYQAAGLVEPARKPSRSRS